MTASITVSERAARRIGDILKGEPSGTMLRVSVEGGGCSGFQYKFDMDRTRAADDRVISREGAVILIDPVSVNYMAGSEIDFVDDLIRASFKVNNPASQGVLRLRDQLRALIFSVAAELSRQTIKLACRFHPSMPTCRRSKFVTTEQPYFSPRDLITIVAYSERQCLR